ncbi:unnamed protein product [Symbiodinium natans]|uniref:Uncharacterized protein n=1 Tax=Symbiodinium natans TaxID=878477 RepID=A0A812P5N9_9DINO|nr:unnamed protein product [Symbiodinium natans]
MNFGWSLKWLKCAVQQLKGCSWRLMGSAAGVSIEDARGAEVRAFHSLKTRVHQSGTSGAEAQPSEPLPRERRKCHRVAHVTSDECAELASSMKEECLGTSASFRVHRTGGHSIGVNDYTRQLARGRLRLLTRLPGSPGLSA